MTVKNISYMTFVKSYGDHTYLHTFLLARIAFYAPLEQH